MIVTQEEYRRFYNAVQEVSNSLRRASAKHWAGLQQAIERAPNPGADTGGTETTSELSEELASQQPSRRLATRPTKPAKKHSSAKRFR